MARLLVALFCFITIPRVLVGQADTARADTVPFGVRLRFATPALTLKEPEQLRAPWLGAERLTPALRGFAWDSTVSTVLDSTRRERSVSQRLLTLYGEPLQPLPSEEEEAQQPSKGALGLSKKYADLAMDGQVRLEIRTDRLKNERCAPALLLDPNSGCQGGFKPPRLDNQVNVRSGGVIGQRVHLAVDYDTERDFSANNNIQVYYQGLEDEIVRRIEVGTVTFQPPQSRFITAAIPANNFGVNARFEVGPLQFQTLAATQKGSQVAERVYTIGQTTSQPQDRQLRDLDFETGRFFWVVDPTTAIPNYPAIDILNLSTAGLAPAVQPVQVRVYRYRPPQTESGADPNLGGITALSRTIDPAQSFGPVRWQLLIQGTDYYIDPSGLWFALATKLDQNDYLAVSYTTAAGTTVGSFPAEDQGQGSSDSLRLIVEPKTGPEAVTFRHEMRQIYRAAGTDLDRSSLLVNLSVNRSERPQGQASTYLALLGLASSTDQNVFDRDNRLFPRPRDPDASEVLKESYIIFPTLTPFADPRLSSGERSDSLYRTPLYLLLAQGPPARFQLRLRYNSSGAGDRSTLSLGALQIREGSEQLLLGGRHLERGTDYTISYELGQVTFLNPDALFGTGTGQITARFEEQGIFAVAPTTILGMATTYNLGEVGAVNLIGMYQREQSAFNRPPLGFEASANLIGGVNTALHFKPSGVSHFLSQLTSKPAVAPSLLDVNAEFAFTKPDQNRSGQAYVEEFEAEAGIPLSLQENVWEFGSQPQTAAGVEDIGFAGGFLSEDAVALTWQNLIPQPGTNQPVELRAQDIDTLIRIAGQAEQQETALYFTLHADTAGGVVQQNNASRWSQPERPGRPRWRSMVTPLSPTGLDLTRDEYLEFWVFQDPATRTAEAAGVRLVFDLGTVNEDALGIAPDSIFTNGSDTTYKGRQYIGQGRLDTERSSIDIFDAQVADTGILGDRPDALVDATTGGVVRNLPLCQRQLSTAVPVFPWGDLSGRCTNGNGALDTEDLNGDNVLNSTGSNENVFRYVVSLAAGDKYYVRNGRLLSNGSPSGWQLYRIPIRTPDDTIGTPNLRLIQHLRMTVVAPPDPDQPDIVAKFAMARLRLVGSPWIRRAETPIAGLSGSLGEPTGEVIASIISTENQTDLGYEPPPGVFEGATRRGIDRAALGTQINEKSLRLIGRGLEPGDRAEAYLRFPAGPQNMLSYRTLRVWMRGRGTEWEAGEYQAFIKLGSDDRNFYLYRAPARSTTWDPEFVIDLETWRNLRATLENRWLSGAPPSGAAECGGGDPGAYVICDGPYMVQLADPGINPPNLAAVQEVSAGIYRLAGSSAGPEAELWVDDIRLSGPVSDVGTAMAVDTRFIASDVGSLNASFIRRDGQFHQINSDPTYRTSGAFVLGTNWRLDRFLPTSLGLAIPFSVSYNRTNIDPQLLTGTDIRGDALSGLRTPVSWTANYSLSIRRSQRGRGWMSRGLLDPLSLVGNLTQGRARTELSDANSNAYTGLLGYNLQLNRHGFRLPLSGIAKRLPKWLRESEGGKALRDAEFNLIPSNVRWSSGLTKDQADYSLFSVPVTRPDDELIQPTVSLTHIWRNTGGLTWQPLGMLSLNSDITSTRDLRVYPDSTSLGRLAYAEREFFLGIPVGVERDRTVSTALALTPRISSWLRPRYSTSSSFLLSRTLTSRSPIQENGDSGAFILPQTLNNSRSRDIGVSVDLARLLHQISGDSGGLGKAFARVRPVDYTTRLARGSTYDLNVFEPDLGFMLGFGGLDDFLSHEGESARGATETRSSTLSTGADLPLGFTATISYSLTKTDRFQLVADGFSETSSRQREWPVGSLRWTRPFTRGPITLLAAGAAVRQREGTSIQPGGFGGARSATSSSTFTPDLQLSFRNGLALTASLSTRSQRTENNGNATLLDQDDITGSLNYAFALPASLSRTRKRVRSNITAVSSKTLTCLEQGFNPECIVVSDVRRQEIRGGLDTDLLKTVTGGLQFGYSINDARHLSRRTSQIFVLLSLQLSLYAGDYR